MIGPDLLQEGVQGQPVEQVMYAVFLGCPEQESALQQEQATEWAGLVEHAAPVASPPECLVLTLFVQMLSINEAVASVILVGSEIRG